jgi:hypothetical protein
MLQTDAKSACPRGIIGTESIDFGTIKLPIKPIAYKKVTKKIT